MREKALGRRKESPVAQVRTVYSYRAGVGVNAPAEYLRLHGKSPMYVLYQTRNDTVLQLVSSVLSKGGLVMCLQCMNDIENLPGNHPNYDQYVRDLRADCPYPYWKRLRDERRKKQLAKGHEARKSLVHLQEQCFFNARGGVIRPGSRAHMLNMTRIRFSDTHGL